MIKIEKVDIYGFEPAIRGMRNPMNSWEKSDSGIGCKNGTCEECNFKPEYCGCTMVYAAGPNDLKLMKKLAKGGPVHAKYRRMITVYLDITAPLYWWKEFDTYKIGTVANSCSTMHKIHEKEFTLDDFSCEHLFSTGPIDSLIETMNHFREMYVNYDEKKPPIWGLTNTPVAKKDIWWQMIQLLPSSYNQKRTVMLNYEVLVGIYEHRRDHKLDEWVDFCKWIETLPYSELITGTVYHVTKLSAADSKDIVLSDGKVSIEEAAEAFKDDPIVKAVTDEKYVTKKHIGDMSATEIFEDFYSKCGNSSEAGIDSFMQYLYNSLKKEDESK